MRQCSSCKPEQTEMMRIRTSEEPPHLTVAGEVDFANSWRLRKALDRLIGQGCYSIKLDLHDVDFIDSSGIAILIGCAKTLHQRGGGVSVMAYSPTVYRILFGCGLAGFFGMADERCPTPPAPGRAEDRWLVCSFTLPMSLFSPSIIRDRIGQVISDLPLSETEVADVKLAVGEAATNAVRHGSKDGKGNISIRCVADCQTLTIEVSDDGPGFDRKAVPKPDFTALPTGGMGIAIMELVMDQVVFQSQSGMTVRMLKRLSHRPSDED